MSDAKLPVGSYQIDEYDTVRELDDLPKSDPGAPMPILIADDSTLLLTYIIFEEIDYGNVDWERIKSEPAGEYYALIEFMHPYAHLFGPPNDEAMSGHPLFERGVNIYRMYEIENSSWIRSLERMNAVHLHHDKAAFLANKRHFIFAFHDTTFECVATGYTIRTMRGSMQDALTEMAKALR